MYIYIYVYIHLTLLLESSSVHRRLGHTTIFIVSATPMLAKLFKHEDPQEQTKLWRRNLSTEMRKIDTQIRKIQREEMKVKQAAKTAARKGDTVAVRMLSKEIIRARHAVKRLYSARTQMNSISMHLQQQASQIKLAGNIQKSAVIMTQMNELMRVQEVQATMRAMSKEMMKAGLIEETINDTVDNALDEEISNAELDDEVNKVVEEVMHGKMQGTTVGQTKLPQTQQVTEEVNAADEDEDDLLEKFNALRGSAT
ncbi:SNF7-like protein, putative [Trypanosoma cruzi marinkellei]|uniref:SNF7-like protein, putative n=1 Tax=Trypanosoma cruzi marinkellei TaxID=85056 RepID=K2NJQ4_TRYCR|nr:SNF7-like protein, putative [Trypanosoma cruzi marinkellei]